MTIAQKHVSCSASGPQSATETTNQPLRQTYGEIKDHEVVDARLWSKAAALEKIGRSIGMFDERMDVTSGGAPLTDLFLEDEMFELLAIRRAMRARDVSKPKVLEG